MYPIINHHSDVSSKQSRLGRVHAAGKAILVPGGFSRDKSWWEIGDWTNNGRFMNGLVYHHISYIEWLVYWMVVANNGDKPTINGKINGLV